MIKSTIITVAPGRGGDLQKMYEERRRRAVKFVEDFADKDFEYTIMDTEVNNLESHVIIWNQPGDVLVFEDDIIFDSDVMLAIKPLIEEFKLRGSKDEVLYLQRTAPYMKNLHRNFRLTEDYGVLSKADGDDFAGTAAYFITEETKKHILDNLRMDFATDKFFMHLYQTGLLKYVIPTKYESQTFKLDEYLMWYPHWR